MFASLFLFCRQVHLSRFLDATYKCYHTVFVFLFLVYFSLTISKAIHGAAHDIISFFFITVHYSMGYMQHNFFILSADF